mgnify:CR=1 FL=1
MKCTPSDISEWCSNPLLTLKSINDKDSFLNNINENFINATSHGVMVSMNVIYNDNITLDGSTTILRKDSSWNIWFIPCYNNGARRHASNLECCDSSELPCDMAVGFGWIWDPIKFPTIDCLYYTDSNTINRKNTSNVLDRCSELGPGGPPINCSNMNQENCINEMLKFSRDNKCPSWEKCYAENEIVILRYVGHGQMLSLIDEDKKPSALLFVYDPHIFGSKGEANFNRLKLSQTLENEKIKNIYEDFFSKDN